MEPRKRRLGFIVHLIDSEIKLEMLRKIVDTRVLRIAKSIKKWEFTITQNVTEEKKAQSIMLFNTQSRHKYLL